MSFIKYLCGGSTPPVRSHATGAAMRMRTTPAFLFLPSQMRLTAVCRVMHSSAPLHGGGSCRWNCCGMPRVYAPAAMAALIASARFCSTAVSGEINSVEEGKGLQEAEAFLRERFGPQAKLVLRRCPRRRARQATQRTQEPEGEEEEAVVVEDEEPVAGDVLRRELAGATRESHSPQGFTMEYRASATCRLLGFPVELAAANGQRADEVLGRVLQDALDSDVIFILPQPKGLASSQVSRGRGRGHAKRGGYRRHTAAPSLSPRQLEFKAIMDELRELCVHFSRVLKFAIRSPSNAELRRHLQQQQQQQQYTDEVNYGTTGSSAGGAGVTRSEWICRAYVRDEWGVAPALTFTGEVRGQSANDALMRCFAMLRDRYRNELESALVQLESVREVEAFVRSWGKTVESHCFDEGAEEPSSVSSSTSKQNTGRREGYTDAVHEPADGEQADGAEGPAPVPVEEQYRVLRPTTFTAAVIVEDVCGNISVNQVKRQATPLTAYQNASGQALRSEAAFSPDVTILDQCLPSVPLITRMRWQFDAMVHRLAKEHEKKPEEVAVIRIEGDRTNSYGLDGKETAVSKKGGAGSVSGVGDDTTIEKQCVFFTACFISDGSVVWQNTGPGRYRLEFDCYVQGLTYLLDQYPDVGRAYFDARGGGVLFPTTQLLELAVLKHDSYNIAANHRGKWNVYALLGTLTSQLLGSFYQTAYQEDRVAGEARAILTVNDGLRSKQLLIQRQAKKRGEAWRSACLDALRENFPNQYRDALLLHPDIDLSSDTMARGSKFRALPREKRVEHVGNLFSLVAAFAAEDLGWHNLRVRLRNASGDLGLPQWVAEMEAQIEGEEQRRVVAISPPYSQVKHARRVLVYQLAQKYFPKELEAYAKLNRGDAVNPDQDARNVDNAVYRVGAESFVSQVLALLEAEASSMAPFTWTLEQYVDSNTYDGNDNDGSVECLLCPFHPRFRAAVYGQNGDVLISERIGSEGEGAVVVLCSVLRAATNRFAGDKGEQLWTEYECHAPPPVSTLRELALYMFNAFFGVSNASIMDATDPLSAVAEQQVVDVEARELGGYWFVTLSLSRVGGLAVSRAIAMTKREGVRDVVVLACRRNFPRPLQYLLAHSKEMSSFAGDIFAAPVVEELPEPVMQDIKRGLERAESAGPPRPYTLLRRCVTRDFRNERWLRVEQLPSSGSGFACRIYLQKHRRESKKGEVQLVGFGSALTRAQALHIASLCALENLFEKDLAEALACSPGYRDLPSPE
ncbi:hypothetical protein TraAM80_07378 [Trypanosoma rangeli]|uniref:Uncharacterized protein n=1 Tax=Trypanosoma rangeli TaxID=5698 RepID=A0A3R7M7D8_TRYRA|nr:uncharacterized protein TraAM80_07378 [Trypanosoma rangeli]RNF00826.1 hypothetical protein TraAM80_07378 [Trypanosoma rangeli]|eukprot:RNF00826.1 hypothetical protein TraAM80_07378 [Trypanosoma rangeli]